ncbi:hypothetical protein [Tardiphaga sp. 839_C3_N1_4]|uniref:hypothetical protein n=1 Tax=Tardiphaga sp. 839_C3_N1_4 TaxID=3240761 RepID=UPI003F238B62
MAGEYTPREIELLVRRDLEHHGAVIPEGVRIQILWQGGNWRPAGFFRHEPPAEQRERLDQMLAAAALRLAPRHRLIGQ